MRYLVGTFQRWHSELFEDKDPFYETKLTDEVSKNDLVKAREDDGFQVIDLITRSYYNPKSNTWEKINSK